VGDRVIDSFYPTWFGGRRPRAYDFYGTERDGWLTEYKAVDAEALAFAPAHLSFAEAATLPCAGVTAWSALAGVGPGDTVLTQGTGGVSLFAVQLAKILGARVIATTSNPEKATRLKALGADSVIDYVATPEWADAVRRLTEGRGADRIVEVGGPGTLAQSIKAVAYGGHVSIVGALSAGPEAPTSIDFMNVFMSQATYRCIGTGSRSDLEELCRAVTRRRQRSLGPLRRPPPVRQSGDQPRRTLGRPTCQLISWRFGNPCTIRRSSRSTPGAQPNPPRAMH
jgi:NADPH:quinone reductase-like Zn-dependent oxidoreductase